MATLDKIIASVETMNVHPTITKILHSTENDQTAVEDLEYLRDEIKKVLRVIDYIQQDENYEIA